MEEAKGKLSLITPLPYDFRFDFVFLCRFHFLTYRSQKAQKLYHDETKRDFNFTASNCDLNHFLAVALVRSVLRSLWTLYIRSLSRVTSHSSA